VVSKRDGSGDGSLPPLPIAASSGLSSTSGVRAGGTYPEGSRA
jgi:hypothetical protein